jgi:hypothetical protein
MRNPPLALFLLIAAACGCSVRVELADESTTTAEAPPSITTEKSRTAVEVGVFTDNQSEPAPAPPVTSEKSKTFQPAREPALPPSTHEPPARGADDLVPVKPAQNSVVVVTNVVNIKHLDREWQQPAHPSPVGGRICALTALQSQ